MCQEQVICEVTAKSVDETSTSILERFIFEEKMRYSTFSVLILFL